ncbi:zf-HC2 domain-containing protein [Actinacidiphila alni]|uniref:zf-HC2 domain-containing protein n=1 Tax=Actinacidiphila alni TaxID=380248 RepID=UPI0033CBD149
MTPHVDVGAYLLGALDDAEMTRFEEHLAGCESCGRELDELSGLLPVLEEMREDGVAFARLPDGDAMLDRLLAEVSGERRARKRRRLVAVAAAAVLVIGGPAVAVLATDDGGGGKPVATQTFSPDRRSASDPATGVRATVGVADKNWGSVVDLRLSGVRGPLTCKLVVVARDGNGQTVASWSVPAAGYGVDTQPTPLTVHGAAGLHKADISRFDVRAEDGKLLVSVPM